MGIISRLREWRSLDSGEALLTAILSGAENVTREQAMNIPAFAGCVRFISETAAGLPIKLYCERDGKIEEVANDPRYALLNEDTGDILSGRQFKQAIIEDMLIDGGGYAYINRERNKVRSLHYVQRRHISFLPGTDPIYKSCSIAVNGREYRDFEFIKVTRSTKDGVRGSGIIAENPLLLSLVYNTMRYESAVMRTGGNRKGFLKAEKKLSEESIKILQDAWEKLNSNDNSGMMVLNSGLDFKESAATSVELQLVDRKKIYTSDICGLFGVPPKVISGGSTDEEYIAAIKISILPALAAVEAALNHDLLLEGEKLEYFWSFDTKELLRGSIEKRYKAYKDAIESNVLQIDEARYMENLPPLGINFIRLGLQDVLFDPVTNKVYTPNTGMTENLKNEFKEGREIINESGD